MISFVEYHMIKFHVDGGIRRVQGGPATSKSFFNTSEKGGKLVEDFLIDMLDIREYLHINKGEPIEDVAIVLLEGALEKYL